MFLLLSAFSLFAAAQTAGGSYEQQQQWDGSTMVEHFGHETSFAGDVNQDGFDDIIVGAFNTVSPSGDINAGSAKVYSGQDGSLIWEWFGAAAGDQFGISVAAAGDVDQDGFDDVIVGINSAPLSSYRGAAHVYSGATGLLMYQWNGLNDGDEMGQSVASAGDLNQDGFDDLLVSVVHFDSPGMSDNGAVIAFSGLDGSILQQWFGFHDGDEFGASLAAAGDFNNDGFPDVIIGAPNATSTSGLDLSGSAFVFSGTNGALLFQVEGAAEFNQLGSSVSTAGDINLDGFDDVLVGSPWADVISGAGVLGAAGVASIYSGQNGTELQRWAGPHGGYLLGDSVSAAGDVNGDGLLDVLIGASGADFFNRSNAGAVYLYSAASGELLHSFEGDFAQDNFGNSVSAMGDANGDGLNDIVIGAGEASPGGLWRAGSVFLFDFSPFLTASTSEVSAALGTQVDLELEFSAAAASYDYRVLFSAAGVGPTSYGVDIPLTLDSLMLDSINGNYPFPSSSNLQGSLDVSGQASASFTTPAGLNPALIGQVIYMAAISNPATQLPEFSSFALSIEITP